MDSSAGAKSKTRKKKKRGDAVVDDRFKGIAEDPKFHALPVTKRKVTVDARFAAVFSDSQFATASRHDRRGRPTVLAAREDLSELYEVEKEGESDHREGDSTSEEEDEERITVDLARGEGNLSSTSSESSSEWEFDSEGETGGVEHAWASLDRDAPHAANPSARLAVCNMDWEHVRPADLLLLFSSFAPSSGVVNALTVYVSDYGRQKLAEEEEHGPRLNGVCETIDDDVDNLDKRTREAIRAYQFDRLRYHYAIVECDCAETADAIYSACDGIEYEMSGVRIDLRFVPESMQFDSGNVKERVTPDSINIDRYRPKVFENEALVKSNTKFRWDETDPNRLQATRAAFTANADLDQLQDLVAPGSSSDDEEEEDETGEEPKAGKMALLEAAGISSISEKREKKPGQELSISWQPGENIQLSSQDSHLHDKKKKGTPWDAYLEKRKEKRKERKALIAQRKREARNEDGEEGESQTKKETVNKKRKPQSGDAGTMDLGDARFTARLTNPAFHVDPADARFRESRARTIVDARGQFKTGEGGGMEGVEDDAEAVVANLKNKASKWNRKKKLDPR